MESSGDRVPRSSVVLIYMAVDYKQTLSMLSLIGQTLTPSLTLSLILGVVGERLEPGGKVVAKLQLNPDYSKKSAKDYAKRPNTRKLLVMARHTANLLRDSFEMVIINHMIQDREGERTACLTKTPKA